MDPYPPEELAEFRTLVQQHLATAQHDLHMLQQSMDADRDTSEPGGQTEGELRMSHQEVQATLQRQRTLIRRLQDALVRLDNGTYGICTITGRRIPKERLRLVPFASISIEPRT